MSRIMSDAEIRRRKKAQAVLSETTGGLGLAALGGTLAASTRGRNTLRKIPKLKEKVAAPKPKDPNRDKIKDATTPILATAAGLGGIGSFNFGMYTNAESRKRGPRQPQPVKKSSVPEPMFSEIGKAVDYEAEISEQTPVETVAKTQHAYQQIEINKRRRNNFKKDATSAFGVVHE